MCNNWTCVAETFTSFSRYSVITAAVPQVCP
jgi:hypothetical protein